MESFYALRVSFEKIHKTFAKEPDKLFWTRLKEKAFAFVGKRLEHLVSIESFCVHRPKFLTVSAAPGYKILRQWLRCLYNNVINRLCVATSQSTNDRREQMLCLYTNQVALIGDASMH